MGNNASNADSTLANNNEEENLLGPEAPTTNYGQFKPLKTIPFFGAHLVASALVAIGSILIAILWHTGNNTLVYSILLYLRSIYWVVTKFLDRFIENHHKNLRNSGYLEFYRTTIMQNDKQRSMISSWDSVLLAIHAVLLSAFGENFWENTVHDVFTPALIVAIFNVIETIVLAMKNGKYIAKVLKFNKDAQPPDVFLGGFDTRATFGLMPASGDTVELLERQADLIDYLKEHNQKLNEKLYQLRSSAAAISVRESQ